MASPSGDAQQATAAAVADDPAVPMKAVPPPATGSDALPGAAAADALLGDKDGDNPLEDGPGPSAPNLR